VFLVAAAWLGAALYVYQPWDLLPFDIWDYQEFLPVIRSKDSVIEQFDALAQYYAGHGRANLALYASMVAQWHWFGDATAGWQILRFVVMALNVGLVWILLYRLGLSWFAAAAGAGLFLAGWPAYRSWVQVLGEQQALTALVLAALVALRYQTARRWGWRVAAIVALLGFVMLSKEVLSILAIPILLLACCWREQHGFGALELSRRNVTLCLAALALATGVVAFLYYVRTRPEAVGYGMAYGQGAISVSRFTDNLMATVLPFWRPGDLPLRALFPPNILFVVVVVLGWSVLFRSSSSARRSLRLLGWILLFPVLGVLAYLPWPKFDSFYALASFLGSAMLLGVAVSSLEARGGIDRMVVRSASVLIVFFLSVSTQRANASSLTSLRLNVALARHLPALATSDSVIIVGPRSGPRRLPVRGTDLRRYARVMGYATEQELPLVVDLTCEDGAAILRSPPARIVLVSYSYGCGTFPAPTRRFSSVFGYRSWTTLAPRRDSMAIDLLVYK
jgi:hypothetical protein